MLKKKRLKAHFTVSFPAVDTAFFFSSCQEDEVCSCGLSVRTTGLFHRVFGGDEKEHDTSNGTGTENETFTFQIQSWLQKTSIMISPVVWVWNVRLSLFFPALPLNAFFFFSFSPCVAHCTLSLVTTSTPPNTGVRKEDETRGNVREASFNKALKYYLKLKDIHTCLKSSPPLSSSLLLSTVAGVGWFPW